MASALKVDGIFARPSQGLRAIFLVCVIENLMDERKSMLT